jgi:hypothetical protein
VLSTRHNERSDDKKTTNPHLIVEIYLWQVQRKRKKWEEKLAYCYCRMANDISIIPRIRWKHALVFQHGFPIPFRTLRPNISAPHGPILSFRIIRPCPERFPADFEPFMHVTRVYRVYIHIKKRGVLVSLRPDERTDGWSQTPRTGEYGIRTPRCSWHATNDLGAERRGILRADLVCNSVRIWPLPLELKCLLSTRHTCKLFYNLIRSTTSK